MKSNARFSASFIHLTPLFQQVQAEHPEPEGVPLDTAVQARDGPSTFNHYLVGRCIQRLSSQDRNQTSSVADIAETCAWSERKVDLNNTR